MHPEETDSAKKEKLCTVTRSVTDSGGEFLITSGSLPMKFVIPMTNTELYWKQSLPSKNIHGGVVFNQVLQLCEQNLPQSRTISLQTLL